MQARGAAAQRSGGRYVFTTLLALAAGLASAATAQGQTGMGGYTRGAPSPDFFATLPNFYDGNYRDALSDFLAEGRGGIKNGPNRWIDSICYHAMCGECYYQMGLHAQALDQYSMALTLHRSFSDWMIRVQFENAVRPAGAGALKLVPWGQSKRQFKLGAYKDTTLIGQGNINNSAVVQRGGVVQQATLYPINVQEIVRCSVLALRRRRELMGPVLSSKDPLHQQLLTLLTTRPGQPNHWSEAWIDLQLGVAFAAVGKDAQAKEVLGRAIVAGGEYDHPLTSVALLELGRLELAAGDFDKASTYFEEATYAAVNYYDPSVLEEAFRLLASTHLIANRPGICPQLAPAAQWARQADSRALQVTLLLLIAENACGLPGQLQVSQDALNVARASIGRRDMINAKLGARLSYLSALVLYQQGQAAAGDQALAAAMNFARNGGLRLFQIALVDKLLVAQVEPIGASVAMEAYNSALRDPTPADWLVDPYESLSVLWTPHAVSFDNWFDVALARQDVEHALEISDLAKRHRFLSQTEFGGRLLNLRWVIETPPELLDAATALQRQDLLTRYPGFAQLAARAAQLQLELRQMPLAAADAAAARAQEDKLKQLAEISTTQETILREMALRREPCNLVFPPVRTTKDVQLALPAGHALLAFHCTAQKTHAFLMTADKYGYWEVGNQAKVKQKVEQLLRELGNYEQNKPLKPEELQSTTWKKTSREVLDLLTNPPKDRESRSRTPVVTFPYPFTHIVIVPDNLIWYVPFETLEAQNGEVSGSVMSMAKLRYAPTIGLAVGDKRPRRAGGNLAVVVGRLFPGEDPARMQGAYEEIERAVPGAVSIPVRQEVSTGLLSTLFDRLVVLADVPQPETNPGDLAVLPSETPPPGNTLARWLALPWGGPEQVLLPGFHSSAENALKKSQAGGNDIFLTACGLMANGARTVLLSRWRTGGQSSVDLTREFAQELPFSTAEDAWHRAVLIVSDAPLDPTREPRLHVDEESAVVTGSHPFFWAGYVLIDTGAPPPPDPAARPAANGANHEAPARR